MGRFQEQVEQKMKGQEKQFLTNQEMQDTYLGVQSFLTEIEGQEKANLFNQMHTTLTFLEQLSETLKKAGFNDIALQMEEERKQFLESIDVTNTSQENNSFLDTLSKLKAEIENYYQAQKEAIQKQTEENLTLLSERDALLQKVGQTFASLENVSSPLSPEQEETFKKLVDFYTKALQIDGSKRENLQEEVSYLTSFQQEGEIFLKQFQDQKQEVLPSTKEPNQNKETVFPLFSKINDQIVSYQTLFQDGKYYVKYQLEDGTYYFAVVEQKDALDKLYEDFGRISVLSHEQSKTAWRKNLEVVARCLGMYYQINEYMRYQEISHKGAMTKELDEELATYKKVLSFLEDGMLKQYLDYAASLSMTLVSENAIEKLYQEEDTPHSKKEEALKQFVISTLGNPNAKKEATTEQIRDILYEVNLDEILPQLDASSNEDKVELAPLEMSKEVAQEQVSNEVQTKEVPTNYEEQEAYQKEWEEALLKPLPENVTLLPIARKEEALYKDINTYMDLKTAKTITNTLYEKTNPGQGDYALLAYLKEGKVEGFTGKYQARNLAVSANRNDYIYLMLVEAMKDYATFNEQRKNKPTFGQGFETLFSFVGQNILEENFDGEKMTKQILENDALLISAFKNFDGSYLVHGKGDSSLFEKVLEDYHVGNPMFYEKVTQALSSMHKLYKQDNYQVPTRSNLQEVAIPSGKAVA